MRAINYGCSATNQTTVGNYDYILFSRIDNYAYILRQKTDDTEWLFRVIIESEVIATVWANATSETYVRPDALSLSEKRYVINKTSQFLKANNNYINSL